MESPWTRESDIHYEESDLLPLSGLQHLVFCERQCALIHVEQAWRENRLTAEGRLLHEKADSGLREVRGDLRIARAVPLRNLRLGIAGRADVVELHRAGVGEPGATLPGVEGRWRPFPVEYKRGEPKWTDCDRVQLCAQALCLEEMLDVPIAAGALFYRKVRRRDEVVFDVELREKTEKAARRFHEMVMAHETPFVHRQPKCENCSLLDLCLPPKKRRPRSVSSYLARLLEETTR